MTFLASIPLDLVEEILGHLHGDITTLKTCSTVSLTFYHPSRKLLFSCVVLDTPNSLVNLHTLLNELPEVAALVQTLHLRTFFPTDDMGTILLSVSHRLQHLQNLTLGCNKGLSWSRFSTSNVTALETLIGLRSLRSLEISHVYAIPLPFFSIARGVRRLKMELVYIENVKSAKDAVHFAKLETLSLGSSVLFQKAISVAAPELRQLSVRGPHPSSLESAIQFINSTSNVIVDFSWSDFHFDSIREFIFFAIIAVLILLYLL
ncbi:hypothetical protein BDZ94DRAFT_1003155 [Collybia nuda]|uniref:F-box domain-containing protein n=1 Tax=Collybia nuda TaxID=64659 RepID=A0A9P5XZG7_9AGAR|nr:hypothetical protein BDZ94DRAFT_1003155 [Collybia nuda]